MLRIDGRIAAAAKRVTPGPLTEYRKTASTLAVCVSEPFEVDTEEGVMRGAAGDYLCVGPAARGVAGQGRDLRGDVRACGDGLMPSAQGLRLIQALDDFIQSYQGDTGNPSGGLRSKIDPHITELVRDASELKGKLAGTYGASGKLPGTPRGRGRRRAAGTGGSMPGTRARQMMGATTGRLNGRWWDERRRHALDGSHRPGCRRRRRRAGRRRRGRSSTVGDRDASGRRSAEHGQRPVRVRGGTSPPRPSICATCSRRSSIASPQP
jgi:hypothetical protein